MVLKRVGLLMAQLDCLPYAVGGMVRDRMLGRISGDMDIAVAGDVCSIAQTLARELHCAWFMLDDERGMARLVPEGPLPEWQIDLGHYDGTIEDDLGRRDFTVNAMAAPLAGFSEGALAGLVDPYGGSVDLAQGKLRMVSSGAFESDPLRLLRFARFSASLNLTPDQTVVSAARASARLIAGIPGERIHEELARILSLRPAGPALRLLESVGLMDIIFPSLRETRRIEASGDHQWDVFEHSLRTLEAFEFLGGESDWTSCPVSLEKFPAWLSPLFISLETPVGASNTRRSMAKLGALLHDIGKPATLSREASGRLRFIGHALTGAELAREELSRLRYGKQEIEYVNLLVRLHLRPFQLSNEGLPTGRAVYRFCRDAGQAWREVIMIALADHLATSGPRLDAHEWNERVRLASFIVDERGRQLELLVRPGRLVDGHDLKTAFPSASGPAIGHLLETLEEATSVGSIRTRGEALKLASETILRDNSTNPISRGVTN